MRRRGHGQGRGPCEGLRVRRDSTGLASPRHLNSPGHGCSLSAVGGDARHECPGLLRTRLGCPQGCVGVTCGHSLTGSVDAWGFGGGCALPSTLWSLGGPLPRPPPSMAVLPFGVKGSVRAKVGREACAPVCVSVSFSVTDSELQVWAELLCCRQIVGDPSVLADFGWWQLGSEATWPDPSPPRLGMGWRWEPSTPVCSRPSEAWSSLPRGCHLQVPVPAPPTWSLCV